MSSTITFLLIFFLGLFSLRSSFASSQMGSELLNTDDDYKLLVNSHMNGSVIYMSCQAYLSGGAVKDFYEYTLNPWEPQRVFFTPLNESFHVACLYSCMGNFAADVRVFDSEWPGAEQCRVKKGGCRWLFEDSKMYHVDMYRKKTLIGDMPLKHCETFLWVFNVNCREIHHRNPIIGKRISRWTYWKRFLVS